MTRPVHSPSPSGILGQRRCREALPLGEAAIQIDWAEPLDDELARLLLSLIGDVALVDVFGDHTEFEAHEEKSARPQS